MTWPTSQDYNEAIQDPRTSLNDPELRGGEATTNALGMPQTRSGNFADVYEFHCSGGGRYALKCFTREVRGLQQRYQAISDHLHQAKLPFTVDFNYLEKGVRIRGAWYPLLKMQWVEGFTLNTFVRDHLDKPATLEGLIQIWLRMAKRLREARLAHADLQHGNVLLVPGNSASSLAVRLIDYDGMFIPALAGSKSGEVGHPAYQHPQRLREGTYNAEVDRFPTLVIVTALRCLVSGGRSLWERYDNGDNLLFREADLREPGQSALFAELRGLKDPAAVELVKHLAGAAYRPLGEVPLVEELLPEKKAAGSAAKSPIAQVTAKSEPALDFGATGPVSSIRRRSGRQRGHGARWWIAGGITVVVLFIGLLVMLPKGGKTDSRPGEVAAVALRKPPDPPVKTNKDQGKKIDPVTSDPVNTDPVKPDLVKPDPVKPDPISETKTAPVLTRTRVIGGFGGGLRDRSNFQDMSKDEGLLVGFKVTTSRFLGRDLVIKSLQPIYLTPDGKKVGGVYGEVEGSEVPVEAGDGYAVGGLVTKGALLVDGFKLVFMRIKGDVLDPKDSYESSWFGGHGGSDRVLGEDGKPVVGIHGASANFTIQPTGRVVHTLACVGLIHSDHLAKPFKLMPVPVPETSDGFVALFNGKDLTGWKPHPTKPGTWNVEGGALVGRGIPGLCHLMTERAFYNFHLRIETMLSEGLNAHIEFRAVDLKEKGMWNYNTLLSGTKPATANLTGNFQAGLQLLRKATGVPPLKPGEWFTQDIIANGNHFIIQIKGKTVVDYVDEEHKFFPGCLTLTCRPKSVVRFHKIEIKELPAVPAVKVVKPIPVAGPGVLTGHEEAVKHLLFTPDGSRLVSASNGNNLNNRDGKRLADPGTDNTVRIWQVSSEQLLHKLDINKGRGFGVQGLALTANGSIVIACYSWDWGDLQYPTSGINVWKTQTGEPLGGFSFPGNHAARAVGVSADGSKICIARGGSEVHVLALANAEKLPSSRLADQDPDEAPLGTTFTRDGRHVLGGLWKQDGPFRLWDRETGKVVKTYLGHTKTPWGLTMSLDGLHILSCAGDLSVRLWEIESGKEVYRLNGLDSNVLCVAFSPEGSRFLTGAENGTVVLRDTASGKELARFPGHVGKVHSVVFAPKGLLAASGGEDKTIRLWRLP